MLVRRPARGALLLAATRSLEKETMVDMMTLRWRAACGPINLTSSSARRRGAGVAWSLTGHALARATGYLGGHMSFAQRAGTGTR